MVSTRRPNIKLTMKNTTWLLLLALSIYHAFCNESLLSKFHQHGYKIKDARMELTSYDHNYFNFFSLKTFKYNRTTPAVNTSLNFKVEVGDKLEVVVQGFKFLSNEYRHFPLRFQVNLKKCFDSNAIGLSHMMTCGNLTTFYFYKDVTYYICNFTVHESHFPPLIPTGRYKFEITALYLNQEIAMMHFYSEIYTPIEYPKD